MDCSILQEKRRKSVIAMFDVFSHQFYQRPGLLDGSLSIVRMWLRCYHIADILAQWMDCPGIVLFFDYLKMLDGLFSIRWISQKCTYDVLSWYTSSWRPPWISWTITKNPGLGFFKRKGGRVWWNAPEVLAVFGSHLVEMTRTGLILHCIGQFISRYSPEKMC